jgi:hypothetical protein
LGAKLVVRDRAFVDSSLGEWDSLIIGTAAADNRGGTYRLRVSRPWYGDVEIADIRVPGDGCGAIETVMIPVTLSMATGAPAVRNVVVVPPRAGIGRAGIEIDYHGYVDADSGVSIAVSWSIDDTTVARLLPGGRVVSRCRTESGDAIITAIALTDTTKRGIGHLTVWANASSCP